LHYARYSFVPAPIAVRQNRHAKIRQKEGAIGEVIPFESKNALAALDRDEGAIECVWIRIDRGEIVFEELHQFLSLGREILERIAAHYNPGAREPLFAIQVPLLLRAIEETAHDLAQATAALPLAHRITIGDAVRGYRLRQRIMPAYNVYRMLYPLFNWRNALFQLMVTDRLFDLTKQTLTQWLLKWYIDRIGYHAIELYSGKLLLTRQLDLSAAQPSLPTFAEPLT